MSEKEIQVTREMVKTIVKDSLNQWAIYTIIGSASVIVSGALWVGTIQEKVSRIELSTPDQTQAEVERSVINSKLDFILQQLIEVKKEIKDNEVEDKKYREKTQKDINDFYQRNSKL